MLDEKDNGSQVHLSQDENLIIQLGSNPSTGYSWKVTEIDEAIIRQIGEAEFINTDSTDQPLLGQGGEEVLRFITISSGKTTLSLSYMRPWEDNVEPARVFSVEVYVR